MLHLRFLQFDGVNTLPQLYTYRLGTTIFFNGSESQLLQKVTDNQNSNQNPELENNSKPKDGT